MKKKVISLLLAGAMVFGMCACGNDNAASTNGSTPAQSESGSSESAGGDSESTAEASGNEGEAEEKTVEKPASISWWTHDGLNEEDYIAEWDAAYEELTGIKLEHTPVSNNEYHTLLETAFASGTEPNVFDLSSEQKLTYYASQGGVADLTDLIRSSGIYDRVEQSVWDSLAIDGRIYGIPKEMPSGIVIHVRQDWLDRLGMKVPANYEEYLTMLRAFRDEIDECEIPLTVPGLHLAQNLPEFYWDAEADFVYKDGKWVDGMLEENFKDAMQRLQDAYAEGLIDVEAVTNSTSNCRDKWYSGNTGVFAYWAGKWTNTLTERLNENFPDAKVTAIDVIDESYYRYSAFNVLCIDGRLSDEEVEQVFTHFLNVIFDGEEGSALLYAGAEGYHHETDANGNMTYLNMNSSPDTQFQSVYGSPWSAVVSFTEPEKFPQPVETITASMEILEKNAVFKTNTPVSDTLNKVTADLSSTRQSIIAKIVMGEVSVEDGMQEYYNKAAEFNVEQILKEMNGES
jgi:putative aldouronate transport system substrate-binding protein